MLQESLSKVQQALATNEGKFAALKQHAEQKLEEAAKRVNSLQQSNKEELLGLQQKLAHLEAEERQLIEIYNRKVRENKELRVVAEDTIAQLTRQNDQKKREMMQKYQHLV